MGGALYPAFSAGLSGGPPTPPAFATLRGGDLDSGQSNGTTCSGRLIGCLGERLGERKHRHAGEKDESHF